uniref:NADH-ubiquinone oxidoreductase chain 6 n=1 Tax=Thylacodes squamigerus TaxID=766170 RepID=E2FLV1_9CAEN|nr:NADH dehydrogenase subunit 6 [Thylacodes squamigerus]ADI79417.1 NADH dehydrogenase subunit 6 [Thylacodes squamigerus]
MTAVFLSSLFMCLALLLPLMIQPLSLGLVLMSLTLVACILSGLLVSSWYGYILFLIYVGGMLVMFAYVAALIPNVKFGSASNWALYTFPFWLLLLTSNNFIDSNTMVTSSNTFQLKFYGLELAANSNMSILISLAVVLLLNLVAVVKICYFRGPALRAYE